MKKCLLFLIILTLIHTTPVTAQFGSSGIKMEFQGSYIYPVNDFDNNAGLKLSWLFRGSLRINIFNWLQTELGAGIGSYAGLARHIYYASRVVPVDLRLLLMPFNFESVEPYLYGGFGMMQYDKSYVEFVNDISSPMKFEPSGWVNQIPLGFGILFKISESFALDLNAGATYTNTDNLDYYHEGSSNDFFYSIGLGLLYFGSNENADYDNDGLSNKEEKLFLTDPYNPDTDKDGITDGDEVKTYKTNPLDPDTDHDGIKDGEEIFKYQTDPNKADSDGDGLKDGEEILKYKTNPLKSDTDNDGLSDSEEIEKYRTDPLNSDSDDDGLKDGEEISKYNTDPLNRDTDKDGLSDYYEVTKYKTNPLNPDTDGGTIGDGIEISNRTDPLNPNDDVPNIIRLDVGQTVVLEGIVFKPGKSVILPESEEILEQVLYTLNYNKLIEAEIVGYTDNSGEIISNIKLSERRADAVKRWLVSRGISPRRIITKGLGMENPIAPNNTEEGRAKNRRIEFKRTR
jgi:outer membrane protein OmpA-like peptidoglycan-associated protein